MKMKQLLYLGVWILLPLLSSCRRPKTQRSKSFPYRLNPYPTTFPPVPEEGACTPLPTTETTAIVLVDFIGRPDDLTTAEINALESALAASYNSVVSCAEDGIRLATSVQLSQVVQTDMVAARRQLQDAEPTTTVTRGFSLRFLTIIECRGCSPDIVIANDGFRRHLLDNNMQSSFASSTPTVVKTTKIKGEKKNNRSSTLPRRRKLRNKEKSSKSKKKKSRKSKKKVSKLSKKEEMLLTALCPECQAPTADVLTLAYDNTVQALISNGTLTSIDSVEQVTELEPVPCDPKYQIQQSAFAIDIVANQKPTTADTPVLKEAILTSYNSLNAFNDETCDPLFREIIQIDSLRIVDTNNSFFSSRYNGRRERQLQVSGFTVLTGFSFGCRGCDEETTVTGNDNDGIGRRRRRHLSKLDTPFFMQDDHRHLQTVQEDCVCSLGATVFEPPSTLELAATLGTTLSISAMQGDLSFEPVRVRNILELDQFTCPSPTKLLKTFVSLKLKVNGGSSPDVEELELYVKNIFNRLAQLNCDPWFRTIANVKVGVPREYRYSRKPYIQPQSFFTEKPRDDGLLQLDVQVDFICRGSCPRDYTYLFDGYGYPQRRSLEFRGSSSGFFEGGRDDVCFCNANPVNQRAPTTGEFLNEFNLRLNSTDIAELVKVYEG